MSKIKDLIQQHCPNGVEYKKLGEYIDIYTGTQFNKRDMLDIGSYPVLNGGISPSGFAEIYNEEANTITISQGGASAGYVNWMGCKFYAGAHCFVVKPNSVLLNNRYLYFVLKNSEQKLMQSKHGAGIPGLNSSKVKNLQIPIPPMEVQEEIVRILDTFSALTAELEAELEARKKQYQYYRDKLLSFENLGERERERLTWRRLGECVQVINATKKMNKKFYLTKGKYPIIDQGQKYIIAYTNDATGLLPLDEYVIFGEHTKEIKYVDFQFIQGADGLKILKNKDFILPKYLYHCMQNLKFQIPNRGYNRHWTVTAPLQIPIPSMEEQERVVGILDKFDRLVNDISEGIPAEIKARRQQYEYYRDMLLNFKKL